MHDAIGSIFHPSDFSAASELAFAHALKIALVARSRLDILHVTAVTRNLEMASKRSAAIGFRCAK